MQWYSNRHRSPLGTPACCMRSSGDLRFVTFALGAQLTLPTG